MNVVDDEKVEPSGLATKLFNVVFANRRDKFVCELFARCISHLCFWMPLSKAPANRLQEMCLSHSAGTVQEQKSQWVTFDFGNLSSALICQAIWRGDQKIVKSLPASARILSPHGIRDFPCSHCWHLGIGLAFQSRCTFDIFGLSGDCLRLGSLRSARLNTHGHLWFFDRQRSRDFKQVQSKVTIDPIGGELCLSRHANRSRAEIDLCIVLKP